MFKKFFKAEGGFTLVELLVTLAILGVLFGIVTLTLSGVGSDAQTTVCDAEEGVVQSAIDIFLAVDTANSVADLAPAATITGTDPTDATDVYTDYLRGTTVGTYTITDGIATQVSCP